MSGADSKVVVNDEVKDEDDEDSIESLADRKKKLSITKNDPPKPRTKVTKEGGSVKHERVDEDSAKPSTKIAAKKSDIKEKAKKNKIEVAEKKKKTEVAVKKKKIKVTEKKKKDKERVKIEKKTFDLPGQKRDPPEERDPLRIFYETMYQQVPTSEMASIWMMEYGLLPKEEAEKVFKKKQKMAQKGLNSPAKTVVTVKKKAKSVTVVKKTLTTPVSAPKKKTLDSKAVKNKPKKRKRSEDESSEDDVDDDFVIDGFKKKQKAS